MKGLRKGLLVCLAVMTSSCISQGRFEWTDSGTKPDVALDGKDVAHDLLDDSVYADPPDTTLDPASPDLFDPGCTCPADDACCDGCLPIADGQPCPDDGIACTNDICIAGLCTHQPPSGGCVIGNACVTDGTFDPASGLCRRCDASSDHGGWKDLPDGTACPDDGVSCTQDLCSAGKCSHPLKPAGSPCNDGDPCTADSCDVSGKCVGTTYCYKDPETGLAWLWGKPPGPFKWGEAVNHCNQLVLGGHSDWRLPNIDELRSLVAYCPKTQPGGVCKVTNACSSFANCHDFAKCDCDFVSWEWCYRDPVGADDFCEVAWSTTLCPDKPGTAWTMNFIRASLFPEDKNNGNWYARCVRGP